MTRTFHPVGQGAFYSEEFRNDAGNVVFRAVYDCGCINCNEAKEHGRKVVERTVQGWGRGATIDYLFISHFDYDHVSLLRIFKEREVEVYRVVLPLLNDLDRRYLVSLYDAVYDREAAAFCRQMVESPEDCFGESTKIVHVAAVEGGGVRLERRGIYSYEDEVPEQVPSGAIFMADRGDLNTRDRGGWCYIPCNYNEEFQRDRLRELLEKEFGVGFEKTLLRDFDSLMDGDEREHVVSRLKAIYNRLEGKINVNSMTVYSGPEGDGTGWLLCNGFQCPCGSADSASACVLRCAVRNGCGNRSCKPGCVYTGDVDLKKIANEDWYDSYWKNVGTIQVPHHGSRYSFSNAPFSSGGYTCPISCSDEGYYHHPHACVTNALVCGGNFPIRVTETQPFSQTIIAP